MTLEEQETHIIYDYYRERVIIFTTRGGVFRNLMRRIGRANGRFTHDKKRDTYSVTADMKFFRDPFTLARTPKSRRTSRKSGEEAVSEQENA